MNEERINELDAELTEDPSNVEAQKEIIDEILSEDNENETN